MAGAEVTGGAVTKEAAHAAAVARAKAESAAAERAFSELRRNVAAVRSFNRYYFRRMGFLKDALMPAGYHPSELRVMRELGEAEEGTSAACIAGRLHMDPARVCRILAYNSATYGRGPT